MKRWVTSIHPFSFPLLLLFVNIEPRSCWWQTQFMFFFCPQRCSLFLFELLYYEGVGCGDSLPQLQRNGTWCNLLLALTATKTNQIRRDNRNGTARSQDQAPQGNLEKLREWFYWNCFVSVAQSCCSPSQLHRKFDARGGTSSVMTTSLGFGVSVILPVDKFCDTVTK